MMKEKSVAQLKSAIDVVLITVNVNFLKLVKCFSHIHQLIMIYNNFHFLETRNVLDLKLIYLF